MIRGATVRARCGAWLLACVLVCVIASAAAAQGESARDLVYPRLDRSSFALFTHGLGLDRQQQAIIEMQLADYGSGMDDLMSRADAEADAAGRQRVSDALRGRGRVPPEELRDLRVAVLQVYQRHMATADVLLEGFLESVMVILLEEQRPAAELALRDLRRGLWLEPRRAGATFPEYAGDGVDVVVLAEDAGREGGELAGADKEALAALLESYANEMDRLLLELAAEDRDGALRLRIARIRRDRPAEQREEAAALERWQRLFELNQRTARRIEPLVPAPRGRQWFDRFQQASFPWLWKPAGPDRQHEWLSKQSLDGELRERIDKIHARYADRRRALLEEAVAIMLRSRVELKRLLHPSIDATALGDAAARRLHEDLLKNSGELAAIEEQTGHVIDGTLPPELRKEMKRALRM